MLQPVSIPSGRLVLRLARQVQVGEAVPANDPHASPSLTIHYSLIGTGWANFQVRTTDTRVDLTASYTTDALDDLIAAGCAVLSEGFQAHHFELDEEPGESHWHLHLLEPHQLRLVIIHSRAEYPGEDQEEEWGEIRRFPDEQVLTWTGTTLAFAKAALKTAEDVLENIGPKTYLDRWVFPFPTLQLEDLRAAVQRAASAA